ncbi:MAG: nitroreductase family protein [Thermoplasmatota archaeon]
MEFDDVIRKRRSVRKYTDKKVSDEEIFEILKAAFYSPSASNRRPWHFIVVRDDEKKSKLAKTHKWSSMVADASVIIIVCADEEEASRWIEDASIATEHMHLKAQELGLGSCWIAVRSEDTKKREDYVSDLLDIPENIRVLCLLPIGYPDEKKSEHDDEEIIENRIHHDSF